MTEWQKARLNSYKDKPVKFRQQRLIKCRICGKPVNGSGHICQSCSNFIEQMQEEERTGRK